MDHFGYFWAMANQFIQTKKNVMQLEPKIKNRNQIMRKQKKNVKYSFEYTEPSIIIIINWALMGWILRFELRAIMFILVRKLYN